MNYLRTLPALALSLMLVAGPTAVFAAEPASAPRNEPAEAPSPSDRREGGTLDRVTAVAAVLSIVVVGVAGVYIYGLIRKGL